MNQHPPTLAPRNLGALLDETFAVYGKQLWHFVGLVAIVQVPIRTISVVLYQGGGGGPVVFVAVLLLEGIGTAIVFGAAVFAVGQHYITGKVRIGTCYTRAWWKVKSVLVLTLIVMLGIAAIALPLALAGPGVVLSLVVLVVPVLVIAVLVYWSLGIQAVIIEGVRSAEALRRSFALVRGSWWRVFGITSMLLLVALGLAILLGVPFALLPTAFGFEKTSGLSVVAAFLGGVVVESAVQPMLFIGITLLYYDLRVRKENYSIATMSKEMGIAAV